MNTYHYILNDFFDRLIITSLYTKHILYFKLSSFLLLCDIFISYFLFTLIEIAQLRKEIRYILICFTREWVALREIALIKSRIPILSNYQFCVDN